TLSNMGEDWYHSMFSNIVGVAFAFACSGKLFMPSGSLKSHIAWVGLAVSILIALSMGAFPEIRGVLQRLMFGVSFLFVWSVFVRTPNKEKL
ncbi:MAG: hypothetical protein KTR29_19705, partial [Rhodothermaceae bacterium]|nr:hypothetical protein [Rhodothermaceae bacterium]